MSLEVELRFKQIKRKYNCIYINLDSSDFILIFSSLFGFQAVCFTALGFIFMTMSLTFIVLDWTSGEKRSLGGH